MQYSCLKICINCPIGTAKDSLEVIANVQPLNLRRKQLALSYWFAYRWYRKECLDCILSKKQNSVLISLYHYSYYLLTEYFYRILLPNTSTAIYYTWLLSIRSAIP